MLVNAYRNGGTDPIPVGFAKPDELLLDEMVKVSRTEIEYETASMPDLDDGDTIRIGVDNYTVRGAPKKKADGYFSTAELIKS